jgi:hypothetical protein
MPVPFELRDLDTTANPFPDPNVVPLGVELTWAMGADKRYHAATVVVPAGGDLAVARAELSSWLATRQVPSGEHFVLESRATPAGGTRLTSLLVSDASVAPQGTFVGGAVLGAGESSRVSVGIAPAAEEALRVATGARIGHTVVMLVDGEVLTTAVVRSAIGGTSLVINPPDLPGPEAEAWCRHLVAELTR